jgi:hypothetical protein
MIARLLIAIGLRREPLTRVVEVRDAIEDTF